MYEHLSPIEATSIRRQKSNLRPFAANLAAGEAGVAAGQDADELDVQRADGAVVLGNLGEGAGVFVDEVVAAFALRYVGHAALLFEDRRSFSHAFAEGFVTDAVFVREGEALGYLVQHLVQLVVA